MAKKTPAGFGITCPFCQDNSPTVNIDLNTLQCYCDACCESFTPRRAAEKLATELQRWQAVCRWTDMVDNAIDGDIARRIPDHAMKGEKTRCSICHQFSHALDCSALWGDPPL